MTNAAGDPGLPGLIRRWTIAAILAALDDGPAEGMTQQELVACTNYARTTMRMAVTEALDHNVIEVVGKRQGRFGRPLYLYRRRTE